jgi:hypothetical protein
MVPACTSPAAPSSLPTRGCFGDGADQVVHIRVLPADAGGASPLLSQNMALVVSSPTRGCSVLLRHGGHGLAVLPADAGVLR